MPKNGLKFFRYFWLNNRDLEKILKYSENLFAIQALSVILYYMLKSILRHWLCYASRSAGVFFLLTVHSRLVVACGQLWCRGLALYKPTILVIKHDLLNTVLRNTSSIQGRKLGVNSPRNGENALSLKA